MDYRIGDRVRVKDKAFTRGCLAGFEIYGEPTGVIVTIVEEVYKIQFDKPYRFKGRFHYDEEIVGTQPKWVTHGELEPLEETTEAPEVLKVYKVSRTDEYDYGDYSSWTVVAKNKTDALLFIYETCNDCGATSFELEDLEVEEVDNSYTHVVMSQYVS